MGGSSETEGRVWLTTHMSEMACGWYDVVAEVSGYLVVYFLLPSDVTRGSSWGYSVGKDLCRKGDSRYKLN